MMSCKKIKNILTKKELTRLKEIYKKQLPKILKNQDVALYNEDFLDAICCADACIALHPEYFWSPYLFHGSPMKLFEYMASGRAICASDLPVLREILSEDIAILLPPEDIESWVAALRNLRDNPSERKRMANKAQQAVAQYSWDTRAQKILEGI